MKEHYSKLIKSDACHNFWQPLVKKIYACNMDGIFPDKDCIFATFVRLQKARPNVGFEISYKQESRSYRERDKTQAICISKTFEGRGSISLTVNCEAEVLSIHFEYADMESFNVPFRRSRCDLGATLDNLANFIEKFPIYCEQSSRIKIEIEKEQKLEKIARDTIRAMVSHIMESENIESSRSKFLTLNKGSRGSNIKYAPYAFTEQGVYMLMTVLKGERATAQSKALIRLFKQMKDYIIAENRNLLGYDGIAQIAVQTERNTKDIAVIQSDLQKVMENFVDPSTFKHFLILNGRRLDADVAYTQIYGMAKKSITIIDDYVGVKTLDLLRGIAKGVSVMIYSDENGYESLTEQIQKDFLKARPDVKFNRKETKEKFHDRYIFLDYGLKGEKLFHCGASRIKYEDREQRQCLH